MLEPCAGKLARTVLRGPGTGNSSWLPDVKRMIKAILNEILPTIWSRLFVGCAILLVPPAIYFNELLESFGLEYESLAKVEMRLIFGLSVLCIFLFLLSIHLLVHIARLKKNQNAGISHSKKIAVNIKKKLEKEREQILLAVSKHPKITDTKLSELLSIEINVVAFHLEELKRIDYVKVLHKMGSRVRGLPSKEEWSVKHLGRNYLIHHELIR